MKPLQVFVRDTLAPVLRRRGFTRSAGTFRLMTASGVAVIEVSGRGGIRLTDLDFSITAGFAIADDIPPDSRAEQVRLGIGMATWMRSVYDPAVGIPMGSRWAFGVDNDPAVACVTETLDQAAVDVVRRLRTWPDAEADSFSDPRVISRPIDPGERPEYAAFLSQTRASIAAVMAARKD